MIAVLTPAEMAEIDRNSPEPVDVLVARAGAAVARAAVEMLGGTYGRRVVIVAGKGNNGADGRVAGARLRGRGVGVTVVNATDVPERLPACDLVIDAAYGTGFRGDYQAPDPAGAPVLAVDIPSGVDGLTGQAGAGAVWAVRTVTFAALKPGLLLHPGADHAGVVTVADIGLDASGATATLVEWPDVASWLAGPSGPSERGAQGPSGPSERGAQGPSGPSERGAQGPSGPSERWAQGPPSERHKWKTAIWVVAGSPGMTGAAHLCSRAAMRAGAGLVRLGIPGSAPDPGFGEIVGRPMPDRGWDAFVLEDSVRAVALVVGPGLGRAPETQESVRRLVASTPLPVIVDADGLFALGGREEAASVLRPRDAPTVLTPHAGEFARLAGSPVGTDRLGTVRGLAADLRATVLLKGSTTVVADPDGRAMFTTAGGPELGTAGTGDVLSGVVGAFLALGLDGIRAAAGGALVHGMAGHLGWRRGLVAGDLLDLLPAVLSRSP